MGVSRNIFMFSARGLFLQVLAAIGWSLITVRLYGMAFWGEVVDYLLFAQIFTIVVDWGSRRYMAGKSHLEEEDFNRLLGTTIMSRLPILALAFVFLLTAPFDRNVRVFMCVWILGKWLQQGLEIHLVYRKSHNYITFCDVVSIIATFGVIGYFNTAPAPGRMIMALATGQLVKALALLPAVKRPGRLFRFSAFRPGFLLTGFPFFLLIFSNLLHFIIDKYFVYTRAGSEMKATYQVYLSLLMIMIYLVTYVFYPALSSLLDAKQRTKRRSTFALSLAGLVLVPFWTWISLQVLEHIYAVTPDPRLMLFGILYAFPYFLYYPMYHGLMEKRKFTYLTISHFSAALINLILCIYLVNSYNIMGALLAAAVSNLSMLALLFIFTLIIDRVNIPRQVEYI